MADQELNQLFALEAKAEKLLSEVHYYKEKYEFATEELEKLKDLTKGQKLILDYVLKVTNEIKDYDELVDEIRWTIKNYKYTKPTIVLNLDDTNGL